MGHPDIPASPAARPGATPADPALLVGHRLGGFPGSTAEEVWLPSAGGSRFGVTGLCKHTDVVVSEIVIAVEEEGSVSLKLKPFHRHLKGWEQKNEAVTSRFIRASGNTIWFDGLTFRRREDGSLQGFVANRHKDGTVKESFPYQQVKAG